MSQSLDDFLEEARKELISFEKTWRENNIKNPETYPLEMSDGNEGLWWEFLSTNNDV